MDTARNMSEQECWALLASVNLGRLALSHHALPAIVPVQYYLDGSRLAICLGHNDLPERALNAVVAFSADQIDPVACTGWAVEVKGTATRAQAPDHVTTECGKPTIGQIVNLDPVTVTGQHMTLCPFIAMSQTAKLA